MSRSEVVASAVAAIQRRAKDPRLSLVPGLAGDLLLIGAALDVLEAQSRATLERLEDVSARTAVLEGMDGGLAGSLYAWAAEATALADAIEAESAARAAKG